MMLPPSKTEHDDCEDNVMALSLVGGGSTIAKRLTQSKMCRSFVTLLARILTVQFR